MRWSDAERGTTVARILVKDNLVRKPDTVGCSGLSGEMDGKPVSVIRPLTGRAGSCAKDGLQRGLTLAFRSWGNMA